MKTNVAVIFGCRSVEHEISIISAVQAMGYFDREKYNVIPLYMDKNGRNETSCAQIYKNKKNSKSGA